jgi:hypothetical protein
VERSQKTVGRLQADPDKMWKAQLLSRRAIPAAFEVLYGTPVAAGDMGAFGLRRSQCPEGIKGALT